MKKKRREGRNNKYYEMFVIQALVRKDKNKGKNTAFTRELRVEILMA